MVRDEETVFAGFKCYNYAVCTECTIAALNDSERYPALIAIQDYTKIMKL